MPKYLGGEENMRYLGHALHPYKLTNKTKMSKANYKIGLTFLSKAEAIPRRSWMLSRNKGNLRRFAGVQKLGNRRTTT